MTHSQIYSERIKKLKRLLKAEKQDVYFIENPFDLLYLTGMKMSLGHLYVSEEKSYLFVDGRYIEAAKGQHAVPATLMSQQNEQEFLKGFKKLGFNGDKISYSAYVRLRDLCREIHIKAVSKPGVCRQLRLLKDESEILKMKRSAKFGYEAYLYLCQKLKPGVTELELAKELELHCLKVGAEKMSFEPIIAFGKNSALPHHHPGKTKLKENDIVLFDLGVVLDGYCSDMTRVHFIGKAEAKLVELYNVNHRAQKAALALCKPGAALKDLDLAARAVMREAKLEEYFVHSLGHGIGLEVHEYPRLKFDGVDRNVKLEEGMAITVEPGLYLPGKGGVRYEDTVIITKTGYTNLYPE